jgi:hypothetical protein
MRKGFLGSLAVLATGAGLTFGQQFMPPGGPPPGPLPGTLPPPGMITGNPPPGVAPGAYAGPSGANAGYMYASPDGHPLTLPPGMEGLVPPGSMGAGAPGGAYDESGYGSGRGILGGWLGRGPRRFWAGAEYLLWSPSSMRFDYPLATTSAPADLGVLGQPSTVGLPLDGSATKTTYDASNGIRAWFGLSFDEAGTYGMEVSGFWTTKQTTQLNLPGNSVGVPVLAVPFYDVNAGGQGSYIVSFPGINSGTIKVWTSTQAIGGEVNAAFNLFQPQEGPGGVMLLAGGRFFQLEERLDYYTNSSTLGVPPFGTFAPGAGVGAPASFFPAGGGVFAGAFFGPGLAPFNVVTFDTIRTRNQFFGGNVGFKGDIGYGNWFVELTGKFAAGMMRERVDLYGYSMMTANTGLVSTAPGGLFNIPNELGRHNKDRFAILPEGGITLGYQIFSWLRVNAGYTYIYTNSVIRPSSSISPYLNPTLLPVSPNYTGAAPAQFLPRDTVKDTDYHLHGFTAGVQISF